MYPQDKYFGAKRLHVGNLVKENELRRSFISVAEGKNAMSIINAIRNKLALRMFAVIRDDRDFVENYVRKCA